MLNIRQLVMWWCLLVLLAGGRSAAAGNIVEVVENVPVGTRVEPSGLGETSWVWYSMFHSAKKTIDLEEFYVHNKEGGPLDRAIVGLEEAASKGVKIRLLIDSKFYEKYPQEPDRLRQFDNVSVRTIDFSPTGGIQHSKYFVVDGESAFVGSANFDWVALEHVHEIGLRIMGDEGAAASLEAIFERDWARGRELSPNSGASGANAGKGGSGRIYLINGFVGGMTGAVRGVKLKVVASPAGELSDGVPDTLSNILQLIAGAKRTLKVQVYEYSTRMFKSDERWYVLDRALREAAARGVAVQLLVDKKAMKEGGGDLRELSNVGNVRVRAVTIPQWSGGEVPFGRLVHSKYMVVDGATSWVGSENWSGNYFLKSRNVGVVVEDARISGMLTKIFDNLWASEYAAEVEGEGEKGSGGGGEG